MEELSGGDGYISVGVWVTWVYTFVKTLLKVCLRFVHFTLCQLLP